MVSRTSLRGLLVALLLCLVTLQTRVVAQAPPTDEQFLHLVSETYTIPLDRIKVSDRLLQAYPSAGTRLYLAKVLDIATGEAYTVALDAAGQAADPGAAEIAERDRKLVRFGKLDPRLKAQADRLAATDTLPVSIWLNVSDLPLQRSADGTATIESAAAVRQTQLAAVRQHVGPPRLRVLDMLAKMGVPAHVPEFGPAIFTSLTPSQMRKLARHPDVDMIYGTVQYTLDNDDATTTERVYRVWAAGNLGAGASSRPVVHEPDGVSNTNPYLNNATHPVIYWCSTVNTRCPNGKNITYPASPAHASLVGGVIASTHPLVRGVAPSAQLILSANSQDFTDANLVDAFEWAHGNGGDPTNMSWGPQCSDGQQNFMSRYVDWAVRNLSATIVVSSGNTRGCSTRDLEVGGPGAAWSVITVGSFDDHNSGFWAGDTMSSFSRYVNPAFATGMEKPEVVTVGQGRTTTDTTGISPSGVDGTSFSAPAVAGQVVLMFARRPTQSGWPETNKATVLASAYHDLVSGRSQDGVGGVMMTISDDTYRLGRYTNDCNASCFPLTASDFPRSYVRALTAGARTRVAIAWDAVSTGGAGSDVLGADLDLAIFGPDNTLVATGSSLQNSWEVADFTAAVTGNYTFRVNRISSMAGWPGTFVGMAYSTRTLPNICTGIANGVGTLSVNTTNGPTFFDSYAGWTFLQSGREFYQQFTLSSTKDINVTDTNAALDLHIVQFPSCTADPIVFSKAVHGSNAVTIDNAPAGTYYLIVDGRNGAVGADTVTISLTGP